MQQLTEQLDLDIYSSSFVSWWTQPIVLLGALFLITSLILVIWFKKRRSRERVEMPVSTLLVSLLEKGIEGVKQGRISLSDAIILLTSILKSYTAWLLNDKSIKGLTDQEWLILIKNIKQFQPYIDELTVVVSMANQIKFNYVQVDQTQVLDWLEKAVQIIEQINVSLAEHE
ncbi:TPA: hypothetical protein DIC20_02400 [Candidatus Dependentiae bacterium]|nr:MAG: hypothetical protein US03_C0003G0037 [candidate division TM6 bacterium GW2011_GWF2_36_131]KKQ03356.1 MAG: hypothetical protein US13_C0003G0037 [candidate division TM6 bacterium GW2011_GWE2_36_25]KKQ19752.1 MAG: hypothetical protein US32_C0005G0036 [candidate division TM6 bacterium GW2011_GWA2_36_9]HBR70866.1 hypothetical protein [Candidatus Dependentiae bacterium]HCU00531.1 hypothetical protein [Candidatus Dependentiae bacterium]